jgi:hypothetical protein
MDYPIRLACNLILMNVQVFGAMCARLEQQHPGSAASSASAFLPSFCCLAWRGDCWPVVLTEVHQIVALDERAKFADRAERCRPGHLPRGFSATPASSRSRATSRACALVCRSARLLIFVTLAVATLLCVTTGFLIVVGVSRPITAMTATMRRLATHSRPSESMLMKTPARAMSAGS